MAGIKGVIIGGSDVFAPGAAAFQNAGLEIIPSRSAVDSRGRADGRAAMEAMGTPGLQFAAIGLAPAETFKTALTALERGLHVICEPPFCLSTTEFETLREAAEKAQRSIFPAQPWERSPALRALGKTVDRGLAGDIVHASAETALTVLPPGGWSASAALWQAFSTLLSVVRRPPSAVEARLPEEGPAAVHIHFPKADGFAHLSCGAREARLRVSVSGDRGSVETDGRLLRIQISGFEKEVVELSPGILPGIQRSEWLAAEISDFRKEIEGERPRCLGLRNARYCVKLMKNASYSASVRSAAIPL